MSRTMVKRLILKDWYFQRWPIAGYLAAGLVALLLIGIGGNGLFYAGTILLLTVLVTLGVTLPMATVVGERTEQTLPFVMSLPISPREYTLAKIVANTSIFLVPWITCLAGTMIALGRHAEGCGLIPFAVLTLTEIFAAYCLLLGVAIVTESMGWTVGVMLAMNLFFQGFLYSVSHIKSIDSGIKAHRAVWGSAAVSLLSGEVAAIVLLLALTFVLQSRKTDFL